MRAPLYSQAPNGDLFSPLQGSLQKQFSLKPMLGFLRERHYVHPRAGQAKPMCSRDQSQALPISVEGEEVLLENELLDQSLSPIVCSLHLLLPLGKFRKPEPELGQGKSCQS